MTDGIMAFARAMLIRALIDSGDAESCIRDDAESWLRDESGELVIAVLNADCLVNAWLNLSLSERQERLIEARINKRKIGARNDDEFNGITRAAGSFENQNASFAESDY